jgi:PDZ domain-containing protein
VERRRTARDEWVKMSVVLPQAPAGDAAAQPSPSQAPPSRSTVLALSGLVTAVLLLVLLTPPAPYAVESPGPTVDTLGEVEGEPMVRVNGAPTYPTEGSLMLTTVETRGGPRSPVNLRRVVRGWLSRDEAVVPVEQVYPPDLSADDFSELLAAQMTSSQENAVVAALTELGYDVPAELVVAGTVPDGAAHGLLEEGDVIRAAGGSPLPTFQVLADLLRDTPPGTAVTLEVDRGGEREHVEVVTRADGTGGSLLGVYFDPDFDLPVDVALEIERVGGPSAGLVFALAIVDTMTPGAVTGGERIAGTGTISLDGLVGPITSVGLKVEGAARDGADYFLAPEENCADAERAALDDGIRVVPVATLREARAAVGAIGEGRAEALPHCRP